MIIDTDAFRTNLMELMEERDLSQAEFAELIGSQATTVNRWINGTTFPRLDTFAIIVKALNISAEKLLKGIVKE